MQGKRLFMQERRQGHKSASLSRAMSFEIEGKSEEETGGLGSSHTTPCGAAVPARPPTRSSDTTGWPRGSQWVRRATGQGTAVVVQRSYSLRELKVSVYVKYFNINRIQDLLEKPLPQSFRIVLTRTSFSRGRPMVWSAAIELPKPSRPAIDASSVAPRSQASCR